MYKINILKKYKWNAKPQEKKMTKMKLLLRPITSRYMLIQSLIFYRSKPKPFTWNYDVMQIYSAYPPFFSNFSWFRKLWIKNIKREIQKEHNGKYISNESIEHILSQNDKLHGRDAANKLRQTKRGYTYR